MGEVNTLNKHNNSYWYEIFAKSTLEVVFEHEFDNLRLSDKPDLIDDSTKRGIEVTHPTDEKHEKLNSYYHNHLEGKRLDEVSEKGLSRFRSNLYDVVVDAENNTICAFRTPYKEFNIEVIYQAIDKKVKKLNENLYDYSDNISLYLEMSVASFESSDYSVAEKILNYSMEMKENNCLFLEEIFYDCLVKLYRINLKTRKIVEIDTFDLGDVIEQRFKENMISEKT